MALTTNLFPPAQPPGFRHLGALLPIEAQIELLKTIQLIAKKAPFTTARTKSGGVYSAEMTNCGDVGWWSDQRGYYYSRNQPSTNAPWPPMPDEFITTLDNILTGTDFANFLPDACLINRYSKGAKMGLHQDRDEADLSHPIVTLCLGAAADFQIGGLKRSDKANIIVVQSGDALIMSGASRLCFHGVRKIYPGTSPLEGLAERISLTFRKAL